MTTKVFCDGCDCEIARPTDVKRVRVAEPTGDGTTVNNPRDFDLCGGCYGYFKNRSLPTAWVRAEKIAAA